MQLESFILW